MPRPRVISDERILRAAREVFEERGYAGASAAEIARRAGVSEGILFHRHATKAQLFRAALDLRPLEGLDQVTAAVGRGDVRRNLEEFAVAGVEKLGEVLPGLLAVWSNRSLFPDATPTEVYADEVVEEMTRFFRAEMRLGRLRRVDAHVLGHLWAGAIWSYCIGSQDRSVEPRRFARDLVAVLWLAIAPPAAPALGVHPEGETR